MHWKIDDKEIISRISSWLDDAVIGLQLCPFAKAPRQRDEIRFVVSHARNDEALLRDLADECMNLSRDKSIETTLLIIAEHLQLFDNFNQFLALGDKLLQQMSWEGRFQVASFHPHYQFADTAYDDRQNWTNRAPFPVLHLLRETSLSHAIDSFPCVEQIPLNNIIRLNELDDMDMRKIFLKQWHETEK